MYTYMGGRGERVYIKEAAHVNVALGNLKSDGVTWQVGDPRKSCSLSLKAVCWPKFFLLGGRGRVCFIQAFN